jgi:hypothetical protein
LFKRGFCHYWLVSPGWLQVYLDVLQTAWLIELTEKLAGFAGLIGCFLDGKT